MTPTHTKRRRTAEGGSLKRSLGMASGTLTIPKAFGFEDATQSQFDEPLGLPLTRNVSTQGRGNIDHTRISMESSRTTIC